MNSIGLTKSEAEHRLESDGSNLLPSTKPRNFLQQFVGVVRELMLTLLVLNQNDLRCHGHPATAQFEGEN